MVVVTEEVVQANEVAVTLVTVVVAEGQAMDSQNRTLMTSMSPTLIATLWLRNGKSSGQCEASSCKCVKVAAAVAAVEAMTIGLPPIQLIARPASAVSANNNNDNNNQSNHASVVSEITERGSQSGRSFGRGAYNNNCPEATGGARAVRTMISSAHLTGKQQTTIPHSVPEQSGANDIDNHADTICAGPNWKLLELSGKYCNFPPVLPTLGAETSLSLLSSLLTL